MGAQSLSNQTGSKLHFDTANRLQSFSGSTLLSLTRQAAELKARGSTVINLSTGVPNYPAPEFLLEAGRAALSGHNSYGDSRGSSTLRTAVADRFARLYGVDYDADNEVTITAGASGALQAALLSFINPGDEVVVLEPYYESYLGLIALAGGRPRFARLQAPDFRLTEAILDQAFSHRTKAIILNSPHNPTGRVFCREELQMLAHYCQAFCTLVISDDAYAPFVFAGEHVSVASLPEMRDRTISIGSVSKVFNVAGWRIGEVLACRPITAAIRQVNELSLGAAVPLQEACVRAVREFDSYVCQALSYHRPLRDELAQALNRAGLEVYAPEGTLSILAGAGRLSAVAPGAEAQYLLEHCGILAVPGCPFYSSAAPAVLRFSFCRTPELIARASDALGALSL